MRDLTTRARAFIAAGSVAAAGGIGLGERDLLRIGVLLVALPLLAALLLRRGTRTIAVARSTSLQRVQAGGVTSTELALETQGRTRGGRARRSGPLLVEDARPRSLGPPARFVVDRLADGESRTLLESWTAERRGRYRLGPTTVRAGEPFGLVDRHWVVDTPATLLVTPRVEPLPRVPLTGSWATTGDTRARDFVTGGVPDMTIREYRQGDDLRMVHWPSSARVGELMVRQEEQPMQSRATLLVDDRTRAHRGRGDDSSLETAVVAAASIVCHLSAQGFQVRLVTAAGEAVSGWRDGTVSVDIDPHLEHLALLRGSTVDHLASGWLAEDHHGTMVIAVLGDLDASDLAVLGRLASTGTRASALALEVDEWATSQPASDRGTSGTAQWLRSHGWRAAPLQRDEPIARAWQELAR